MDVCPPPPGSYNLAGQNGHDNSGATAPDGFAQVQAMFAQLLAGQTAAATFTADSFARVDKDLATIGERLGHIDKSAKLGDEKHQALEAQMGEKTRGQDDRITTIDVRVTRLDRVSEDMLAATSADRARLANLERELVALRGASTITRAPDPAYNREVDFTILRLRSSAAFTKEAARDALHDLSQDTELSADTWAIVGDALSKNFVVKFTGAPGIAGANAQRMLRGLRLGPGQWRKLTAALPDDQAQPCAVWLNEDKSQMCIDFERWTKKLRDVCKDILPDCGYYVDRSSNMVCSTKHLSIAKLEGDADHKPVVRWNTSVPEARQLQAAGGTERFKTAIDRDASATWV